MNNNGALVISLDFELLWGVFDKVDWRKKKEYFQNTRKVIPEILRLFEEYNISCTWATVGMLLNDDWDEWNQNVPDVLSEYENEKLSAYRYGKAIQSKKTEEFCFAPDLIRRIKETQGQEIGTHTYSHYYCLEPGRTQESFKTDLEKSAELAKKYGIELKSLVFPRNQYNVDYLKECRNIGVNTVRINPDTWYWKNTQRDSFQQKLFRTGDAYFGFNDKSYNDIPEIYSGITGQKASRFLRPFSGNQILDNLRIQRIRSEMTEAAKNKKIYHLWWHPHNFGNYSENNLRDLRNILSHFEDLKRKYNFNSYSMKGLNEVVNE